VAIVPQHATATADGEGDAVFTFPDVPQGELWCGTTTIPGAPDGAVGTVTASGELLGAVYGPGSYGPWICGSSRKLAIAVSGLAAGTQYQAVWHADDKGTAFSTYPAPITATVSGAVTIPVPLEVDGTVDVGNFPATQPVSGEVTADQGNQGTIAESWFVEVTDGTDVLGTVAHPLVTTGSGSGGTVDQGDQGTIAESWFVEVTDGTNVIGTPAHPLAVDVENFPATQPVSGTVDVGNFPATQPVSGTVAVSNFPATQPVSGTVAVTQSTSPWVVSGTVAVSGVAGTVAVTQSGAWTVAATQSGAWTTGRTWVLASGTDSVTVTGTVAATQSGSWTVAITGTVAATQSGAWTVAATQSGTWTVAQGGAPWSVNIPTGTPTQGQAKIATGGTAVQLTSSSTPLAQGIVVQALKANTAAVYVGPSGVTDAGDGTGVGWELQPGQCSPVLPYSNADAVYINAATVGSAVCWAAI
jgi:hypothetical protein